MPESEHGSVTHNIDLARGGDGDAKAWLWERYRRLLYAMAQDHSNDDTRSGANDTSDIVAEVGLRMSKDNLFAGINDRKHFKYRLKQVISGKAKDQIRRANMRKADVLDDDAKGKEDIGFLTAEMYDILKILPLDLHETAIQLMEFGNERDAAESLEITRHALRQQLEQIREQLKMHLDMDTQENN
jgi:hypothetical protein